MTEINIQLDYFLYFTVVILFIKVGLEKRLQVELQVVQPVDPGPAQVDNDNGDRSTSYLLGEGSTRWTKSPRSCSYITSTTITLP